MSFFFLFGHFPYSEKPNLPGMLAFFTLSLPGSEGELEYRYGVLQLFHCVYETRGRLIMSGHILSNELQSIITYYKPFFLFFFRQKLCHFITFFNLHFRKFLDQDFFFL